MCIIDHHQDVPSIRVTLSVFVSETAAHRLVNIQRGEVLTGYQLQPLDLRLWKVFDKLLYNAVTQMVVLEVQEE